MKKSSIYFVVLLLILFSLFIASILINNFLSSSTRIKKICFAESCFEAELARTFEERQSGLMFRSSLEKNRGMLFIFEEEGFHSFWMKNTLIPLDIIWLNKDLIIVDIKPAEPCRSEPCILYVPKEKALYALEVNRGSAGENSLTIGDIAEVMD